MLVFLVAVIFVIALIFLVITCHSIMLRRCHKTVVGLLRSIKNKLMYNAVLRSLLETYLQVAIVMWYGWRYRRVTDELSSKIDFLLQLLLTVFCFAFPILQHRFLAERVDRAGLDTSLDARFGSLYSNVKILSLESLAFSMVFLARHLAFAYTICHIDGNITI